MDYLRKFSFLLSSSLKRRLIVLLILMFIGMLFEMAGIGILIPVLGLLLNSNIRLDYPILQPYLHILGDPSDSQLALWGMLALVLFYLIKSVYLGYFGWRQSKFIAHLSMEMVQDLFYGYINQPYIFHLQRNSAQLIRNLQTEVSQFLTLSQAILMLSLELAVVFGITVLVIITEPVGAFSVSLFLFFSVYLFQRLTGKKLLSWGKIRQDQGELINQHLFQGLGGIKDVKFSGREKYFVDQLYIHNYESSKITIKYLTMGLIPRLFLEFFAVIGIAGITTIMILQNKSIDLLIPTLGLFAAAAFRLIPSVSRIMNSFQSIRFLQPVVNVLYDEFYLIRNTNIQQIPCDKLSFSKKLTLKGINFSYTNASLKTLENINIIINRGETVGFMGPSGSGKSTLVDVILGLLTPETGDIYLDGQNIECNVRGWQDQIGYVPQNVYLTDDTIYRNVAFGIVKEKIDHKAVERAIKSAQLEELVESLPNGLETFVGERGIRLSGGQRQRIGIARALYHDPEVLVLDEATSSLDTLNESGVMQAVRELKGEKTILIVAHRLSTINICNRIYKISHGKIVDEGIPEEMLSK